MLAEIPGRGLVEIVPEISGPQFRQQMLVSGVECKQHCYDNFIMCGDHRAETSNKLTQVTKAPVMPSAFIDYNATCRLASRCMW